MKISLQEMPTLTIVFFRVAFTAIALGVFMKIVGQPQPADFTVWRSVDPG